MRRIVVIALAAVALSGCGLGTDGDWDGKGCSTVGNVTVCRLTVRGKKCDVVKRRLYMGGDMTRTNCDLPK